MTAVVKNEAALLRGSLTVHPLVKPVDLTASHCSHTVNKEVEWHVPPGGASVPLTASQCPTA